MKVHHIAITVNDLKESEKFYQDFFGFQTVQEFERVDLNASAVFMELAGFKIELWQFTPGILNKDELNDLKVKGIRHLAFEVENLDKILLELNRQGIAIRPPQLGASGHRYSFLSDPNGVALELFEK